MRYIFLGIILLFYLNAGDYFDRVNPPMTKEMKINQRDAKPCAYPIVAKETFSSDFRYGCFCGKGYPDIKSPSNKKYSQLNYQERKELVSQYYKIKPYDSIDELCMKHDICYIYKGREDQSCNDALYNSLRDLEEYFKRESRLNKSKKALRCKRLALDISSVFRTIFGAGDNISFIRFGFFGMVTTPMLVASKVIQEPSRIFYNSSIYPLLGERCNIDEK